MESGFVGIPKNVLGLMEPLGLTFDDIGKMIYLLYCGSDKISKTDRYAVEAAKTLHKKGLINWFTDEEKVDFSPMFDIIGKNLGDKPVYVEKSTVDTADLNYSEFIKKIEKKLARFLSYKEKLDIQKAAQKYNWSFELLYDMYLFYQSNYRRQYAFSFFTRMAFSAKVEDKKSFAEFVEKLNYTYYKVKEIKGRLGQTNYPTEEEKECYLKWVNEWKFSHELVLLAVKQTLYASNPTFGYLDGILRNWYSDGIKTPEAVEAHINSKKNEKKKETKKENKKGAVQNFSSNKRDLSYLVE